MGVRFFDKRRTSTGPYRSGLVVFGIFLFWANLFRSSFIWSVLFDFYKQNRKRKKMSEIKSCCETEMTPTGKAGSCCISTIGAGGLYVWVPCSVSATS